MKTVQEIVSAATRTMVTGAFRDPRHLTTCMCLFCENAAARLLSDYQRDIDEAIRLRDKPKKRKTKRK